MTKLIIGIALGLLLGTMLYFTCTLSCSLEPISFDTKIDTNHIAINATLPFGCAELTTLKYPTQWEGDPKNYGQLQKRHDVQFKNIAKCFNDLHVGPLITAPLPQKMELIEIGDLLQNANNVDTAMQKSIAHCRYRLPNMGIYECYYAYQHYGNLMLFDPKTNVGKLINIFANDLGGDGTTMLRYFNITQNEIYIYEAYCYDDGCRLDEKYKIIVDANGTISTQALKK
jgi:hypothetical protein